MNKLRTLDRDKTVERILKGEFPLNLLEALASLDMTINRFETNDDEDLGPALIKQLMKESVEVVNAFRSSWAAYEGEEEEEEEEEEEAEAEEEAEEKELETQEVS